MYVRRLAVSGMRDAVFFAAFTMYVAACIDPRLIFHWQGPVFTTIPGFLAEHLSHPGGPVDYLQSFLMQAYAHQWWGAIVITAQVGAVVALTHWYLEKPPLQFVPAALLLYHLSLYYDRTPLMLSVIVGLGMAILFRQTAKRLRSDSAAAGLALVMLAATYYLAGMAVVFFAPAAARYTRFWMVPLLASAPLLARNWFLDPDPRREIVCWGLYLFYPVAGALPYGRGSDRRLATALVFLGVVGVAVFSYHTSARDRRLTALDYSALHEDWAAVLAAAKQVPSTDFNSLTRYEVNLALHETNRLGDEMFRYPQKGPILLDLRADAFLPYMIQVTDMCLRLGRINEAERFGSEAMLLRDRDPNVYRQMAMVNLVKGQTAAASKFLTVLSYDWGSAGWAAERLRVLDRDQEVERLRKRMLRTDDMIPVWQRPDKPEADAERLLRDQLEQDPSNRMAFEFLMGHYLLAGDIAAANALMPHLAAMTGPAYVDPGGGRRTPRYYQEAMAIYANTAGAVPQIEGLRVEPETLSRFERFKSIVRQYVTKDAAVAATRNEFRDSYYFYFTFGPGEYR